MAMRRNPRTVTKVVGILTDPHPEFVSLVPQGAIQQPLKVVKAVSAVVDIHRITFDKSVFKTADEASAYLAGKGYSDYELTERDGAFVVDGLPEEDFEGELETITAQKGIIMVVGRTRTRKSAAAASTEAETETGAESVTGTATETDTVTKGDESLAGGAAADSVAASAETAPVEGAPADDAVETVERSAEVTAFVDGFATLVTRAAIGDLSEVAYLTRGLVWAAESRDYDEALNGAAPGMADRLREIARELIPILQTYATEAVESIAALTQKTVAPEAASTEQPGTEASAETAAVEVHPGSEADAPTEAVKTPEQPGTGSTDAPATEGDQTTGAAGETVVKEPGPLDAIAAALAQALSPITAALTELSTKTDTALTNLGDQVTKATERVEALEVGENRQTRKSGDIEDVAAPSSPASTQEDAAQAQRARRALRDRVGI